MSRIAVLGTGRIGFPVMMNLVRAGHDVCAFDIDPAVRDAVVGAGARWAESAVAAARARELLITVLPGSPELSALMLGDSDDPGLLATVGASCDWVDLTSAAPDLGTQLAREAAARGVGYLDAPVGGGVLAARSGELTLYVGGDAALLDRLRPVLSAFAATNGIRHTGAGGTGYLTKLLVNLLWFGQALAVAEALLLGQRAGLAPDALRETLLAGPASSAFLEDHLPSLLAGDYLTSFGLDRCVEELESLQRFAAAQGLPFTLSDHVTRLHREALDHLGPVNGELAAVAYLEQQAGSVLRARPTTPE